MWAAATEEMLDLVKEGKMVAFSKAWKDHAACLDHQGAKRAPTLTICVEYFHWLASGGDPDAVCMGEMYVMLPERIAASHALRTLYHSTADQMGLLRSPTGTRYRPLEGVVFCDSCLESHDGVLEMYAKGSKGAVPSQTFCNRHNN